MLVATETWLQSTVPCVVHRTGAFKIKSPASELSRSFEITMQGDYLKLNRVTLRRWHPGPHPDAENAPQAVEGALYPYQSV